MVWEIVCVCVRYVKERDRSCWWSAESWLVDRKDHSGILAFCSYSFSTFYWHAFVMWCKNFPLAQNIVFVSYVIINTSFIIFFKKVPFNIIKISSDLEWANGSFVLLKRSVETCRLTILREELVGCFSVVPARAHRLCTGSRLHGTVSGTLLCFSDIFLKLWSVFQTLDQHLSYSVGKHFLYYIHFEKYSGISQDCQIFNNLTDKGKKKWTLTLIIMVKLWVSVNII